MLGAYKVEASAHKLLVASLALAFWCAQTNAQVKGSSVPLTRNAPPSQQPSWHRDWQKYPAIVQFDTDEDIYVIGDPHADYVRLSAILYGAHLIAAKPSAPNDVSWTAGRAVLVFTGDYIDKGHASLQVIALLRALQASAALTSGRVVMLMGNHEAEFLAAPHENKVDEFASELHSAGMSPDLVASCSGDLGGFLCSLPFAARVNDWFMSHAGNTAGRTLPMLANDLQSGVDRDGFASPQLIGDDSILEARLGDRPWFDVNGKSEEDTLKKYTAVLGVAHIVQGHQPGKVQFADGEHRRAGEMFQRYGLIFLEDTGMSEGVNDSLGSALVIKAQEPNDTMAICPDGSTTLLWDSKNLQTIGKASPCGR